LVDHGEQSSQWPHTYDGGVRGQEVAWYGTVGFNVPLDTL